MGQNKKLDFKKLLNLLAFIAVVAIAISLLLGLIFKGNSFADNIICFAQYIAYFVVCAYALFYVISQRNPILTIVYAVAVIAIVVLLIV